MVANNNCLRFLLRLRIITTAAAMAANNAPPTDPTMMKNTSSETPIKEASGLADVVGDGVGDAIGKDVGELVALLPPGAEGAEDDAAEDEVGWLIADVVGVFVAEVEVDEVLL